MDYFYDEVSAWEKELSNRNMQRMYKTSKTYRDPRKEVMKDYRHRKRNKIRILTHECKEVRILTNRKFRRKMKRKIMDEVYYKIVPHDYKTYGWLTW